MSYDKALDFKNNYMLNWFKINNEDLINKYNFITSFIVILLNFIFIAYHLIWGNSVFLYS